MNNSDDAHNLSIRLELRGIHGIGLGLEIGWNKDGAELLSHEIADSRNHGG